MSGKFSSANAAPSVSAGPKQWWGLAILALPCFLYSMDLTVLYLAIPQITADLNPSSAQLLWIVDIYGFLLAGALVTMGAVGDRIGRRRLLMLGAFAFSVASVIAAFSTSATMLIAARALLGLAAATLAPSTLSLIRTMFGDERQRSFAVGVWMACFSIGGAIGPLVGGLLLEYFWWGSVFLISVPVMVVLLVTGSMILPEYRNPKKEPIDITSAILSISATIMLVYGIKNIALGNFSFDSIAAFIGGTVLGAAFITRQKWLTAPLFDVGLFRIAPFRSAVLLNLTGFFLAYSTLLFLAQYLQIVLGMGALEAGLWTMISAAGFVTGSVLAPSLLRYAEATFIMTIGTTCAAIGFALLATALWSGSFVILMTASFLFSIGLAPVFALSANMVVGAAPEQKAGAAAAVVETSSEFGGALGIAILGSIATALYQQSVSRTLPSCVAVDLEVQLRDGVGSAVKVLDRVDMALHNDLRDVIFTAYTNALASVQIISMVFAVLAAFVTISLLRTD